MDLSYGPEYDDFRGELKGFLAEHWPAGGGGEGESWEDMVERAARFRAQAVEQGYLLRWVPRQYGGSEQEPDAECRQGIKAADADGIDDDLKSKGHAAAPCVSNPK